MDNLLEMIKKADAEDAKAQEQVARYIMFDDMKEPIHPDWIERALDYFERAAAQKNIDAMMALGYLYSGHFGIELDIAKSTCWYRRAADRGARLGYQSLVYNVVWPQRPPEYFEPYNNDFDYKTLFEYALKGALMRAEDSLTRIGDMYFAGWYVKEDKEMALSLYNEAYENPIQYEEDHNSICDLALRIGECYYKGIVEMQDLEKARGYFQKALESIEILIKRGVQTEHYERTNTRTLSLFEELKSEKIYEPEHFENRNDMDADKLHEIGLEFLHKEDWENSFKCFAKGALCELININRKKSLGRLAKMFEEGIYVEKDEIFAGHLILEYGIRAAEEEK